MKSLETHPKETRNNNTINTEFQDNLRYFLNNDLNWTNTSKTILKNENRLKNKFFAKITNLLILLIFLAIALNFYFCYTASNYHQIMDKIKDYNQIF